MTRRYIVYGVIGKSYEEPNSKVLHRSATISAIRDTYPVATTTIAEDTAIITDLNIVYSLVKERRLSLILIDSIRHFVD